MNQERSESPLVPAALHTILYGGLAIGVLDGIAAISNAGIRGLTPTQVFHYVSSGLLGAGAFNGGMTTVILGIVVHFLVAIGVAVGFYLIARIFPLVLRYAVISGVLYGFAVYFAMAYVIVPLTRVRPGPFSWNGLITGIIIYILFVGLPVAIIAKRYANP